MPQHSSQPTEIPGSGFAAWVVARPALNSDISNEQRRSVYLIFWPGTADGVSGLTQIPSKLSG